MKEWAVAEYNLDELIQTDLGINILQSVVLSTVMSVYQKFNIAKTLISSSAMNEEDKKSFCDLESQCNNLNSQRNTIAHCIFFPTENGSKLKFARFANQGKLEIMISEDKINFKNFEYTSEEFEDLLQEIKTFSEKLKTAKKKLSQAKLASALAGIS